jgi:amino acid transporter
MPSKKSAHAPSGHGAVAAWFVLALLAIVTVWVLYGHFVLRVTDELPDNFLWILGCLAMLAMLYFFGLREAAGSLVVTICRWLKPSDKP